MTDRLNEKIARLAGRDMGLFLGPRPGKKSFERLAALNLTHCCTLLSEREDARSIEKSPGDWVANGFGSRWKEV